MSRYTAEQVEECARGLDGLSRSMLRAHAADERGGGGMNLLAACPKCGCPDELELDSGGIAEASWIECHWCEYRFVKRCDEETLTERWNKLSRKQMPIWSAP